jgi:hypothetical protein
MFFATLVGLRTQWFAGGGQFAPQGPLATSGDTFGYHTGVGGATVLPGVGPGMVLNFHNAQDSSITTKNYPFNSPFSSPVLMLT